MNLAVLLALGSAVLYGAADFTGGLTTRRASTIPVVIFSQASGMLLLALMLPFLPDASPTRSDLLWGVGAGLTGGIELAAKRKAPVSVPAEWRPLERAVASERFEVPRRVGQLEDPREKPVAEGRSGSPGSGGRVERAAR